MLYKKGNKLNNNLSIKQINSISDVNDNVLDTPHKKQDKTPQAPLQCVCCLTQTCRRQIWLNLDLCYLALELVRVKRNSSVENSVVVRMNLRAPTARRPTSPPHPPHKTSMKSHCVDNASGDLWSKICIIGNRGAAGRFILLLLDTYII